MLLYALELLAQTKAFFLALVKDQFLSQMLDHLVAHCFQFQQVEILDALVRFEGGARELLVANLAHDQDCRTLRLNVIDELIPSQMLKLIQVADFAAELWAVELAVLLKLRHSLPDYNLATVRVEATVRKLAEVDEVLQNFVHVAEEGTLDVAVWAMNRLILAVLALHGLNLVLQLDLAIAAEEFVAAFALHRHEGKLETNDALDFFHHFALQLVLDLVHLYVKRRHWLRPQDVGNLGVRNHQVKPLVDRQAILL